MSDTPTPDHARAAATSARPAPAALDQRGRALLDFERAWPPDRADGGKEEAIRATFGFSRARYHQLLGQLIDSPAAYAYDPMTVLRLRRRRQRREQRRTAGALGERR